MAEPLSPVIPGMATDGETIIAENQPQYKNLPSLPLRDREDTIMTRWGFTWRERLFILFRGYAYLYVCRFGQPLQPLLLEAKRPEIIPGKEDSGAFEVTLTFEGLPTDKPYACYIANGEDESERTFAHSLIVDGCATFLLAPGIYIAVVSDGENPYQRWAVTITKTSATMFPIPESE